ncbi:MAG: hypothetical protein ACR2IS_03560, partial [Nitrososphaeraceae archaeon]
MLTCQHTALHQMLGSSRTESLRNYWHENYDQLVQISIRNIQDYNKKIALGEADLTEKQIMTRRHNILRNGLQNRSPEERSLRAFKGVETRRKRYGIDIHSKYGKLGKKNGAKISETLKRKYADGELPVTLSLVKKSKDEVERMGYLIMGLNSYNSYLRRYMKLEINDIKKIYSKLATLPDKEKDTAIEKIINSFESGDTLE